jgi:uncharacterized membrane protein YphA (DoxX/SURF4 family)
MAAAARGRAPGGGGATGAAGLRVLAILLGVFFIATGAGTFAWLTDSGPLADRFDEWLRRATPAARWYIETLALPGVPLFARLVPIAALATGAALILGLWTRLAASIALVMVLNVHFVAGHFLQWEFLRDGTGLPLLGALLALAIGGVRLPFSVSA